MITLNHFKCQTKLETETKHTHTHTTTTHDESRTRERERERGLVRDTPGCIVSPRRIKQWQVGTRNMIRELSLTKNKEIVRSKSDTPEYKPKYIYLRIDINRPSLHSREWISTLCRLYFENRPKHISPSPSRRPDAWSRRRRWHYDRLAVTWRPRGVWF